MKTLLALFLLASTLFVVADAPPILRQRYTTNTQATVDAYISGLIPGGGLYTGSGATVLSNAPSIYQAVLLGNQVTTNSGALVENKLTSGAGLYLRNIVLGGEGVASISETLVSGDYALLHKGTNLFYYSLAGDRIFYTLPVVFTNLFVQVGTLISTNLVFSSSQNTPTSQLTNYSVLRQAESWLNASNNVNFSAVFNTGSNDVIVCNTTITNYSGSNRTLSWVGPTGIIWLSDVPTTITNGTGGIFATKHLSNKVFACWAWQKSTQ